MVAKASKKYVVSLTDIIDTEVCCRTNEERHQWIHEENSTIRYIILKFMTFECKEIFQNLLEKKSGYLERQIFTLTSDF